MSQFQIEVVAICFIANQRDQSIVSSNIALHLEISFHPRVSTKCHRSLYSKRYCKHTNSYTYIMSFVQEKRTGSLDVDVSKKS